MIREFEVHVPNDISTHMTPTPKTQLKPAYLKHSCWKTMQSATDVHAVAPQYIECVFRTTPKSQLKQSQQLTPFQRIEAASPASALAILIC